MAGETANPAGIHPRGMPPDMILLDHGHTSAAQRKLERGRAAMQAPADDQHIGRALMASDPHHRLDRSLRLGHGRRDRRR